MIINIKFPNGTVAKANLDHLIFVDVHANGKPYMQFTHSTRIDLPTLTLKELTKQIDDEMVRITKYGYNTTV